MITGAEHRANFFPDYTTRTAGSVHKIDTSQPTEKAGLSAGNDIVEADEGSFMTLLKSAIDIVNPLHHIPIVSSIYQAVSGDEINTPAKVAGGTVYGGVIGGIVSLATSALEYLTENNVENTATLANVDNNSPATKGIRDLNRTNSAIRSYLDAELTSVEKSTFLLSVEE